MDALASEPNGLTVLIVDDEPVNRLVLARMVEHLGSHCLEAASGPEALEVLRERPVDLVLMDIQMPRMSGIEAVEQLRDQPGPNRDAPVVAMSLVGMADLVCREGDPERAAYLLGAADAIRGSADRTVHDAADVEREARAALGDAGFEAAYGRAAGVTVATALDAVGLEAAVGLDPAAEGPDRERGEDHQQDGRPDQ